MTVDEALRTARMLVADRLVEDDLVPLLEVLAAEVRRLRALNWQPIETADRTSREPVDIWVVPPNDSDDRPRILRNASPYLDQGWTNLQDPTTGRRYRDNRGFWCIDPNDTSPAAYRATHWRPIVGPGEVG